MIALTDLKAQYDAQHTELLEAAQRVLESGWYILGKECTAFEAAFAAFCGVHAAVGVGNGTDAVELALRAVGVEAGDKVATVSHTAVATVAAIEHLGAVPVLVDVDPTRYTMCPHSLERTLAAYADNKSHAIKAVLPVHLYGQCADLTAILPLARTYGCTVVEDCAQAHGATLHGKHAGTMGEAGTFSFYPTKNLGAFGDGGAVITNSDDLAQHLSMLRQYGWKTHYESTTVGVNSRLDEMQAAFLRVRLERLAQDNARRKAIAQRYTKAFADLAEVTPPQVFAGCEHVYHLYVIRSPRRDALKAHLTAQGVASAIHYPLPVHLQAAYQDRLALAPEGLPHTEALYTEILSLPMHPHLSDEDVETVIAQVRGVEFSR